MKYFGMFLIGLLMINCNLVGQYQLTSEIIVNKSKELIGEDQTLKYIVGSSRGNLVFSVSFFTNYCYETKGLIYYDEKQQKVVIYKEIVNEMQYGLISVKLSDELVLKKVYDKKHHNNLPFCEISDLHELLINYVVEINDYSHKLKYSNYFEDDVYTLISEDGRYVIHTPYSGDYLRDTKSDTIVTIYDFNNIVKPRIEELICKECIKPQIANENMFYGKKFYYVPGVDAYDWKIYRAPLFDLTKSELLAEYIEILLISPDGKYILGKKSLHGKDVAVLLDVDAKRFDYLLGRDYLHYNYFYSPAYRMFGFDTENHIIYINYPDEFPFNSTGEDAKRLRSSKAERTIFWEKYKYPPLSPSLP